MVGISYPTAWRMKDKLMHVMCERKGSTRLCGRGEVDDAYLGEFQYRFNRHFDLAALLPRMIVAAVNTGKRPEHRFRLAEDQC